VQYDQNLRQVKSQSDTSGDFRAIGRATPSAKVFGPRRRGARRSFGGGPAARGAGGGIWRDNGQTGPQVCDVVWLSVVTHGDWRELGA
jgi:hypothetical protein